MAKEDAKIIIGGDAQRAVKSLQDVSKNLGGLGNSVSSFLGTATGFLNWQTAAVAGIGALGTGFAKLMSDAIDTADQMANMSKRTGIAVESLSKLAYVAQQSDTSVETLQKSMKFLNVAIYDISAGSKSATDRFAQFGIKVKNSDGTVKSAEETLLSAADAYKKLDSEAAKTAMAIEVFGKAGQELMPMLDEGATGIRRLMEEAKDLGLEMDGDLATASERLNDNLDKLASMAKGAVTVLVESMVPALDSFSNRIDNADTKTVNWIDRFARLRDILIDVVPGFNMLFGSDTVGQKYNGNWYLGQNELDMVEKWKARDKKLLDSANVPTGVFGTIYAPKGVNINKNKKTGGSGGSGGSRVSKGSTGDNGLDAWLMQYENFAATRVMDMNPSLLMQGGSGIPFADDPELLGLSQTMSAQLEFIDSSKAAWTGYFDDIQVGFMDHMNALGSDYGQALGGIASMFEAFANTSAEQQGILFDISKAFRAAEIISSTWSTAQKAYEWGMGAGGPILGGIFMASAIATGIGNLTSLLATQPGQTSISGGGVAPVPNFAQRNPQGGNGGGGSKNITIKFEGFIWDKDRLAREIVPAINRAISDGVGR